MAIIWLLLMKQGLRAHWKKSLRPMSSRLLGAYDPHRSPSYWGSVLCDTLSDGRLLASG